MTRSLTTLLDFPTVRNAIRRSEFSLEVERLASQKIPQPEHFNAPRLALVTFSHFSIDTYSSFLAPLLPLLLVKFHLSLALVGVLVTLSTLMSGLGQPFFGFLADKFRNRIFILAGPIIAAFFIAQIGRAWNYESLLVLILLSAVGAAIFHPQAAAMAGQVSSGRRGFGVSIFMMGGRFGYATGPLVAAYVASRYGMVQLQYTFLPILLVVGLLFLYCPAPSGPGRKGSFKELAGSVQKAGKPLLYVCLIEILRSGLMSALASFLPLLYTQKGLSLIQAGATSTIFLASGAVGSLLGGYSSDRWGRRHVILTAMTLSFPVFYLFLHTSGPISFVFLGLTGLVLLSTLAVTIALAQEMLPASASMASSIMLGFAWMVGSLLSTLVGVLGDHIGIGGALNVVGLVIPVAAFLAWRLRAESRLRAPHRVPAEVAVQSSET